MSAQEKSLVKVLPQLQWRPQDIGDAGTMEQPPRKNQVSSGGSLSLKQAVHMLWVAKLEIRIMSEFQTLDTELQNLIYTAGC